MELIITLVRLVYHDAASIGLELESLFLFTLKLPATLGI